jgi:DNA-binding NarL/FixJ family response regulator
VAVEVFLVEDQSNIQAAMVQMLEGLGNYRIVATVSTEAEALAWLELNRGGWQLAVVDLMLAQGSGMQVIARCRSTAPDAHVVVFSNFVSPGIRAHCVRLGADVAFDKSTELREFSDYCAGLSPLATS